MVLPSMASFQTLVARSNLLKVVTRAVKNFFQTNIGSWRAFDFRLLGHALLSTDLHDSVLSLRLLRLSHSA